MCVCVPIVCLCAAQHMHMNTLAECEETMACALDGIAVGNTAVLDNAALRD